MCILCLCLDVGLTGGSKGQSLKRINGGGLGSNNNFGDRLPDPAHCALNKYQGNPSSKANCLNREWQWHYLGILANDRCHACVMRAGESQIG